MVSVTLVLDKDTMKRGSQSLQIIVLVVFKVFGTRSPAMYPTDCRLRKLMKLHDSEECDVERNVTGILVFDMVDCSVRVHDGVIDSLFLAVGPFKGKGLASGTGNEHLGIGSRVGGSLWCYKRLASSLFSEAVK